MAVYESLMLCIYFNAVAGKVSKFVDKCKVIRRLC